MARDIRLYVINLERSGKRLARIFEQFSYLGLSFDRIAAVDAYCLGDVQYNMLQKRNIWTQALTRGEVACFLSHANALERLIADDVPYGVIFEDDVELGRGAETLLKHDGWLAHMADTAGGAVDIVKLETSGKKVWLGQGIRLEDKKLEAFSLAPIKSTHIMGAAYLISRPAAIKLLDLMQERCAPFDHFLFNFSLKNAQKFTLYQLDPAIAVQAGLASTLEGERAQDKRQLKQTRSLCQTLAREAQRLVRRACTGLWGLKINLFTADQWKRVSFRK